MRDERTGDRETFYFEGGIKSYVKRLNNGKEVLTDDIFYVEKPIEEAEVEIAVQYNDSYAETMKPFANNVLTPDGGMHVVGFRTALNRTINDYARKNGLLKEKEENLAGDDIKEGLTAVVMIKLPDPQFEGQTKNKLGNPEARGYVDKVMSEYFAYYLEEHPQIAKKIVTKATLAARARKAARAARNNVLRKGEVGGLSLPSKLADCSSKNRDECELFIVEGNSAAGSAKEGRNPQIQAILPLRGKVLNTERARLDKMLANQELVSLIKGIGAGIGEQFNIDGLRYDKIIFMTEYFGYYLEENPAIAKKIIGKATLAARARKAARAARDNVIRKGAFEGLNLPSKLADCSSRNREDCELFIVEGNSAAGSAKEGRNPQIQAILPLRGKVLNTERARLDKMLANQELVSLIKGLGVGIGDQFNIDGLRYDKIIFMTEKPRKRFFYVQQRIALLHIIYSD